MENNNSKWRFLNTGAGNGAFNMAVDEVLANIVPTTIPVFRLYSWQQKTISTGYHQGVAEIDRQKCKDEGVDIVRRPTGGRAIFHDQEITYSVIIPRQHDLYDKNALDVYNLISEALVQGLALLAPGIALKKSNRESADFAGYRNDFACFATSAKYEILHQGRKLVGSAQRKFRNGLLQHGSILLGDAHLNLPRYLVSNSESQRQCKSGSLKNRQTEALNQKAVSLNQVMNRAVTERELIPHLTRGFEEVFSIGLHCDALTTREAEAVNKQKFKLTN